MHSLSLHILEFCKAIISQAIGMSFAERERERERERSLRHIIHIITPAFLLLLARGRGCFVYTPVCKSNYNQNT